MMQIAPANGKPMKSSFIYDEVKKELKDKYLLCGVINNPLFSNRADNLKETIHYIYVEKR